MTLMGPTAMVFTPAPQLTVTIEAPVDELELHVHPGGQGIWQASMITSLGVSVTVCACLGGEVGRVLEPLIIDEGVTLEFVPRDTAGSGYVHDRRDGERAEIAEHPGPPLTRHEIDELYGIALAEGLRAGISVLSGPAEPRAADDTEDTLIAAMQQLHEEGAGSVIVSRADSPSLALLDGDAFVVEMPALEAADTCGAGDSMTAGVTAVLARNGDLRDAVRTGAAAGGLNVTRHGLGSGRADAIAELIPRVRIEPYKREE
jgi:1-phosphofructokinase